ncbi:helix-turn-helix domain-containing protein [Streptomyces sp. NPDC048680]|uniref:helix-turn-helix domain-containing protein n=1 Tax=Streptomyces sp. NPDC048680 TaxID=3155492 RepID=UPI00342782B8
MDNQQIIAPSRASSGAWSGTSSSARSGGVLHVNVRHTSHFTVVGNHLAQHQDLSLVAIGLATHIQSLPAGAKVGIKFLVERFPESEARIAGALRELEENGYLRRDRERLSSGLVITRTTSYNQPCTQAVDPPAPAPALVRAVVPAPAMVRVPVASPAPAPTPAPALPRPQTLIPDVHRTASAILLGLRREAPVLVLSENDVRSLTPAVATWLERDAAPATIAQALTTDLPVPLKYPAKLLAHRLSTLLPAAVPPAPLSPPPVPLQNCDACDRAFRAPEPGRCGECVAESP